MPSNQPTPFLYMIYGNNETDVNNARYELVCSLLTPEERDAGLTEIRGPGNLPLMVERCYGEIIEELGTTSFIADSKRVVVVYDLKDFYEKRRAPKKTAATSTRKKKASPKEARMNTLLKWMSESLPETGNILIFVCTENDEKQKTVSPSSPLYDYVRLNGKIIEKREKPLNFDFEDAVLSGNTPRSLMILRDWTQRVGNDSGGRLRIYNTLSNLVEMTLQAKCIAEAGKNKIPRAQVAVTNYPSLDKAPSFKAKKFHNFANSFSMDKLQALITDVNKLQQYMYPKGTEPYIPNWENHLEMIVLQLTMK